MGRHRTAPEKQELGERARALRAEGRSRCEIQGELGIGDDLAKQLLAGTGVPDSLRRPRAKDDLREQAVELRRRGATYDELVEELGVSEGTLSSWLRAGTPRAPFVDTDLPPTAGGRAEAARRLRLEGLLLREIADRLGVSVSTVCQDVRGLPWPQRSRHGGDAAHVKLMAEARWAPYRRRRDAAVQQRKPAAALEVGEVEDRTLLLRGAVAYWCEGFKNKRWRPQGKFTFINTAIPCWCD